MLHEVFLFGVLLPTVITVVCFIGFLVCWFRYSCRRRLCCSAAEKPPPPSVTAPAVCLKCACRAARRTSRDCDEETTSSPPRSSSSGDVGRCERCFGGRRTAVYPAETGVRPIRFPSSSWFKPLWLGPDDTDLEASMMNYVVAEPRRRPHRGPPPSRRTSKFGKDRGSDGQCGCPSAESEKIYPVRCERIHGKDCSYYHRPKQNTDPIGLSTFGTACGQSEGRHGLYTADRMTRLPVDDTSSFDVLSCHEEETFYVEVQPNTRQDVTKTCSMERNRLEIKTTCCDLSPVDSDRKERTSDSIQRNRHLFVLNRDTVYQSADLTSRRISSYSNADCSGLTFASVPQANDLNRRLSDLTPEGNYLAPGNSGIDHIQHGAIVRRLRNGCLATSNNGSCTQNGKVASCANNRVHHPSGYNDLSPPNRTELLPLEISGNLSPQNDLLPHSSEDISSPRSIRLSPQTERSPENSSDLSTQKTSEL